MAVIGSIRKRGTLLMIIIGISLLCFIIGGNIDKFMNTGPDNNAGEMNGDEIHINEYSQRLESKKNLMQMLNPTAEMDDATSQNLADEVWNDLIREKVYYRQYEKLGLTVTREEMEDMLVGMTVHPNIRQMFTNQQTGIFDPQQVVAYSAQFEDESAAGEDEAAQEQWRVSRTYWAYLQNVIKDDRLQSKYTNLINKSVYVTTKEAQSNYQSMGTRSTVRFVVKPYALIPDSSVTLTDGELKKYFSEFGYKFRQKKSRAVKYVMFTAVPTAKDSADQMKAILELKTGMGTTDNDSAFTENSDAPMPPTYYKKGAITAKLDSLLFDAPNGTVAGPVIESGYMIIGKKINDKMMADSVKVRHIVFIPKTQEEVEPLRQKRDSIFTLIQNGAKFEDFLSLSSDPQAVSDSGSLGWMTEGMMPLVTDSAFATATGSYNKAETQQGFHILHVTGRTSLIKRSLISIVAKQINPSNETMQVAYGSASDFASVDGTKKDFDSEKYFTSYVKGKNLVVRDDGFITAASRNLMGMEGTRDVVRWALNAKRGDVSEVFQSGNNYIVATVTSIRVDGIPKLEDVKGEVEAMAKRHKKATQFMEEMKGAAGSGTIDAFASAMKLQVQSAQDVTFGGYFIPGAGVEPELIGSIFGSPTGKVSKPVEGNSGVYVFVVDAMNKAPEMPDYNFNKTQMMAMVTQRAATEAFNALQDKLKVVDNRYRFE